MERGAKFLAQIAVYGHLFIFAALGIAIAADHAGIGVQ